MGSQRPSLRKRTRPGSSSLLASHYRLLPAMAASLVLSSESGVASIPIKLDETAGATATTSTTARDRFLRKPQRLVTPAHAIADNGKYAHHPQAISDPATSQAFPTSGPDFMLRYPSNNNNEPIINPASIITSQGRDLLTEITIISEHDFTLEINNQEEAEPSSTVMPSMAPSIRGNPTTNNSPESNIGGEDNTNNLPAIPSNQTNPIITTLQSPSTTSNNYSANTHHNSTQFQSQQSEQHKQNPRTIVTSTNSQTFQTLMTILLVAIVLVRAIMLGLLLRHRHQGTLRLAQPTVLAVLLVAGTISIVSCFFLVHMESASQSTMNTFCLLRDPFLLTPLTLCGCILLGRVWRIVLLLTPVLQVKDDEAHSKTWGRRIQHGILTGLTAVADIFTKCGHFWYGCKYHCYYALQAEASKLPYHYHSDLHREYQEHKRHSNAAAMIRKQVPVQQLAWLIACLMLPQTLLQICNLSVTTMQEQLVVEQTYQIRPIASSSSSFEATLPEGLSSTWNWNNNPPPNNPHDVRQYDYELVLEECWMCQTDTGYWPTYLGVVFMVLPYIAAALLSWNSSADLPKVFDEASANSQSFKVLALVMIVAIPPLLWGGAAQQPDISVYLASMLIFAVAMPPCWFIVYPKIWQAVNDSAGSSSSSGKLAIRRLLVQRSDHSDSGGGGHPVHNKKTHDDSNSKAAKLALTIGKMYEDMGLHSKSLNLFDEALAVWQVDPARKNKEKVAGGFTKDEIESLSVTDLECILQLLIAKGRVLGTFKSENDQGQKNAAQAWLDALEVYELAPSRANIVDRSMLFPIFSGLFVFIKGGKIQDDERCTFEQNLTKKFVREAKLQGDPVHYTRALAMYCEVKARLGKYKAALENFDTLKKIYNPDEHSEQISEAYGTDRSAQAFSQSALWHMEMGNMDMALRSCNYVLEELIFLMDPRNILNMMDMILPILRVYKANDGEYVKKARDIYYRHVYLNHERYCLKKNKTSPCTPLVRPLMMLLDISYDPVSFPDFEDAVEWLMVEENGVVPRFADLIYTKMCWSTCSITAELCLRIAQRLINTGGDMSDAEHLVLKGIHLCHLVEKQIIDKTGKVLLPIAHGVHQPVYAELKSVAAEHSIEYIAELDASVSTQRESKVDLKNLPNSYRARQRSSDGNSSSERSPMLSASRLVSFASASRSRSANSEASSTAHDEFSPEELRNSDVYKSRLMTDVSELSLDSKFRSRMDSSCIVDEDEDDEAEDSRSSPYNDTTEQSRLKKPLLPTASETESRQTNGSTICGIDVSEFDDSEKAIVY